MAVLIEHDDKVLLETSGGFWNMIGGRVHFGDSTLISAKREIKEELGFDIENLELINVSENFFSWLGYNQQELLFVYRASLDDSFDCTKVEELKCADADKVFKWHKKSEVANLDCKPEIIKELITSNTDKITHKIDNKINNN